MPRSGLAILIAIVLSPALARAHPGHGDTDLLTGLLHPVFGLDHLLAMVSVGVVSVQLGGANIWRLPLAFVAAMTVGVVVGIRQIFLPYTELGIAASVLVLGLGIVFAHRGVPPWPIIALVALFGACHGYAHGLEIPGAGNPVLYTVGFVIGTAVLHLVGMVIGEVATLQTWLRRGLRFTGGMVATSGVFFLGQTLAMPLQEFVGK